MLVRALLCYVLSLFLLVLLVRAVMSWFPLAPGGAAASVYGFLFRVTEPVLAPIRSLLPPLQLGGVGLDLSFMIVFFALIILRGLIC
jgi:YggT family protein